MATIADAKVRLEPEAGLAALLAALGRRGYQVIGPTQRDGAILYEEIQAASDLPVGWGDVQDAGTYRLRRRGDRAFFGYNLGPDSWKKWLSPRRQLLLRTHRQATELRVEVPAADERPLAFVGARACELAAMGVQANVRRAGGLAPHGSRPAEPFVVAVECAQAAATCFCPSMGTGPELTAGYDVGLIEREPDGDHHLLAFAATERGAELLRELGGRPATPAESEAAGAQTARTAAAAGRRLDLPEPSAFFREHRESPHWDAVAQRCLSCANCTLVCPTCFCTTVEDKSDVTGDVAERWLQWDSCFHLDFSYVHGGSVRPTTRSRYRQWLSHKLGTWHDQFGESGCVGCGRCIAWCPVGIDLTEEVRGLAAAGRGGKHDKK